MSSVPLLLFDSCSDGLLPVPQTHRRRYLFNHVHHWMGRIAIVLTIVAIYLGLRLSNVRGPCSRQTSCLQQGNTARHRSSCSRMSGCGLFVQLESRCCLCYSPERWHPDQVFRRTKSLCRHLQEYSDETSKFYWAYGIILGALALLWLAKELIDFVRVKADNKRVDRAGFEVG